jgi:hypothetical protein
MTARAKAPPVTRAGGAGVGKQGGVLLSLVSRTRARQASPRDRCICPLELARMVRASARPCLATLRRARPVHLLATAAWCHCSAARARRRARASALPRSSQASVARRMAMARPKPPPMTRAASASALVRLSMSCVSSRERCPGPDGPGHLLVGFSGTCTCARRWTMHPRC